MTTHDQSARSHRKPPPVLTLTSALLAAAGAVIGGCGGGHGSTQSPGDDGGPGSGNGTIGTITKAANDSSFTTPFDATPSPDGSVVYFTAIGSDGTGGVFSTSAAGGSATRLDMGGILVSPFGITISADGTQLYVADPGNDDDTTAQYGAILALPSAGGTPTVVGGTQGLIPRGVVATASALYFAGGATATSPAGLYQIALSGGTPTTIASGPPFVDPCGVAVTSTGDIYVVDTVASPSLLASVILVHSGQASEFVTDIGVGYPAGIALVQDESALLVSGLDPSSSTDVVYRISPLGSAPQMTSFNQTISAFNEPAGLHRAMNADIYAWADSLANGTGTVYLLSK
jgi:sugar lactone lactonase YvrE